MISCKGNGSLHLLVDCLFSASKQWSRWLQDVYVLQGFNLVQSHNYASSQIQWAITDLQTLATY